MLETDLNVLQNKEMENADENQHFMLYLKSLDSIYLDEKISQLDKLITPQIDCTKCGNCCKTLMINVDNEEADKLAAHLKMNRNTFDEAYLEKSEHSDRMLINNVPCHFLSNNKCTVYEYRFEGCREFPALNKPLIQKRLFTLFMHYGRCPIIYNVIEFLKIDNKLNW